jgi:hypothetical protein
MSVYVPAHLHFIWIGAELPWFAKLAIQSALRRVQHARVTLWAVHDLAADQNVQRLRADARFELSSLDEKTLFEDAPSTLPLDLLAHLFRSLSSPAARANIARLLILARLGGVYLDTDTLTLRDLAPLYPLRAFCGLEHVIWPLKKQEGAPLYRLVGGPLRSLVRKVCASLPKGERGFQYVAPWYETAADNAVLGFNAGHPFLLAMLRRVAELSEPERERRYRLGTHLLQEMLTRCGQELGVHQLAPRYFYPLGPEISRQYFQERDDVQAACRRIVHADTHVIHWYASVSELAHYDEAGVLRQRRQTVFAQLAARAVEDG